MAEDWKTAWYCFKEIEGSNIMKTFLNLFIESCDKITLARIKQELCSSANKALE